MGLRAILREKERRTLPLVFRERLDEEGWTNVRSWSICAIQDEDLLGRFPSSIMSAGEDEVVEGNQERRTGGYRSRSNAMLLKESSLARSSRNPRVYQPGAVTPAAAHRSATQLARKPRLMWSAPRITPTHGCVALITTATIGLSLPSMRSEATPLESETPHHVPLPKLLRGRCHTNHDGLGR